MTTSQGNSGNITIHARHQLLLDGSAIYRSPDGTMFLLPSGIATSTSTQSTGRGGNIDIMADTFSLSNYGNLAAGTSGHGNAGRITINAQTVSLNRAFAFSTVAEGSTGQGGSISIATGTLSLSRGAEIQTSTRGQGSAGRIIIDARSAVSIDGVNNQQGQFNGTVSSIISSVESSARGRGGYIQLTTPALSIRNGAQISVESLGQGDAGELSISARDIKLDQGTITAETTAQNGGNITLQELELLLLRRGSQISASAGTSQAPGSGGNIIINAADGFVVGVSSENSDITANAFRGKGGRIAITAQGIFGLTSRSLEELQRLQGTHNPAQLDPSRLLTSDITAISQTSPALNGQITINTPDVDPSRGLIELPSSVVDRSTQIAQGCTARSQESGRFVVTGRGGLPLSPDEALRDRTILAPDWVTLDSETEDGRERERERARGRMNRLLQKVLLWKPMDWAEMREVRWFWWRDRKGYPFLLKTLNPAKLLR